MRMLYHVHVEQKIEREQVAKVTGTNKDDSTGQKKPVPKKEDKVYPNDRAHAEAARNTNSAVDVRLLRSENSDANSLTQMMWWGYFCIRDRM